MIYKSVKIVLIYVQVAKINHFASLAIKMLFWTKLILVVVNPDITNFKNNVYLATKIVKLA
jgi:hypothetical protein